MQTYATRRFWDRVAQIRNAYDQSLNPHEARCQAIEQALNEVVDRACWQWFEPSSTDIHGE